MLILFNFINFLLNTLFCEQRRTIANIIPYKGYTTTVLFTEKLRLNKIAKHSFLRYISYAQDVDVRKIRHFFIRLFTPFVANDWYINVIIKVPRVIIGAILAFHFGPFSFGMPWSPSHLNLELFEVSPRFIGIVSNFYDPFGQFPYILGLISGLIKCFGGLFLIIGLGTRIVSFLVILLMIIFLVNSHAINFNYIFPLFFISVGCFGLYFGSGKYGLDYLLTPKKKLTDITLNDFDEFDDFDSLT